MSDISVSFDDSVNVGDTTNQIAQIFGDLGEASGCKRKDKGGDKAKDKESIGSTSEVGDGEFRDLVGKKLKYKHVDKDNDGEISDGDKYVNEAYDLLREILVGDGIEGVELVGLDGDSFTLKVEGPGGSVDFLIFEGRPAEEAIALVDAEQDSTTSNVFDLNAGNKFSQFAILDASDPDAFLKVGNSGDLADGIDYGNKLEADEIPALVEQILLSGGYSGVEIIDVDANSISLSFAGWNGSKDTLLITGIEDLLTELEGGPLNDLINNFGLPGPGSPPASDFEIDGPTNTPDDVDGSLFAALEAEYGVNFGNTLTNGNNPNSKDDNNLLEILVAEGGQVSDEDETLTLVGVDSDSFTFSYTVGEQTDYFVFDYTPDTIA